jgi:NAD-dependent SIR2 family protein deacetylase
VEQQMSVQQHDHNESCLNCGLDYEFKMPSEIILAAHDRKLVIFAGAGISTEVPSVFPTTFFEGIRDELSASAAISFPELMERFVAVRGRPDLVRRLKHRLDYVDSFPTLRRQARKFHRALATMPYLQDVITTNWDMYFEESAAASPFVSGEDFVFHDLPGRRVYKIHGSISSLSTLIMTETDYDRRLEELRNNVVGAALRQLLATKIVVFVGYSLSDWNFVRLYEALRHDMGTLAPAAYVVSPFDVTDDRFDLRHIRTSGMGFLRELKAEMIGHCFLPDDVYERVDRVENLAWEANDYAGSKSHKTYPAVVHCWSYIEGLLDACGRIRLRRASGEYSDRHHVTAMVHSYIALFDNAVGDERIFDAAYIDGYCNGLLLLLSDDEHDWEENVPLYFVYGSDLPMRQESDLDAALEWSRRGAPRARSEGRKLSAHIPEDMVLKHGPFLDLGYGSGTDSGL